MPHACLCNDGVALLRLLTTECDSQWSRVGAAAHEAAAKQRREWSRVGAAAHEAAARGEGQSSFVDSVHGMIKDDCIFLRLSLRKSGFHFHIDSITGKKGSIPTLFLCKISAKSLQNHGLNYGKKGSIPTLFLCKISAKSWIKLRKKRQHSDSITEKRAAFLPYFSAKSLKWSPSARRSTALNLAMQLSQRGSFSRSRLVGWTRPTVFGKKKRSRELGVSIPFSMAGMGWIGRLSKKIPKRSPRKENDSKVVVVAPPGVSRAIVTSKNSFLGFYENCE